MTLEEAKAILSSELSGINLTDIPWMTEDGNIFLSGVYSVDEVEAMVVYIRWATSRKDALR